jgi:ABC-type multidrug transport system ATPase subunit
MVLMLDEATTGLDSASTLALVSSMAAWAKLLNCTVVMACQQPEPAVTAHFDDVILMSEGYTVWHGPAAAVMGHFRGLGFEPLPGQDLAEFLQQVASPQEQAGLLQGGSSDGSGGCGSSGTKSPAELSAAFWASQQGQQLQVGLGVPPGVSWCAWVRLLCQL